MYDRASWTSQDDLKHNSDSLYEKKIISNRDFPVEILIKRSSNLTEKKGDFWPSLARAHRTALYYFRSSGGDIGPKTVYGQRGGPGGL